MRRMPVTVEDGGDEAMVESLTRRELEVLRLFAQGATIDEIAGTLTISVFTARNHIANIGRKLGARNRLETVLLGMRRGLV
jgi:two-component system response regulator DesR